VRLFDAWTTLPAGPATLAAKTGSRILPITLQRKPDGQTFSIAWADPIAVPSAEPAALQEATQRMADAFAASIAPAPEQWYSFKPVWPSDPADQARLAARAAAMQANQADPPGPATR
jgi:KDO2-lipid IV(A) lauroyltransferase